MLIRGPAGVSLFPSTSSSSYQLFNMRLDLAPRLSPTYTFLTSRSLATCAFSFHLSSSSSFHPNSMICTKKAGNRWPRAPVSLEEDTTSAKQNSPCGAKVGGRDTRISDSWLCCVLFWWGPLDKVPTSLLKMLYGMRCQTASKKGYAGRDLEVVLTESCARWSVDRAADV